LAPERNSQPRQLPRRQRCPSPTSCPASCRWHRWSQGKSDGRHPAVLQVAYRPPTSLNWCQSDPPLRVPGKATAPPHAVVSTPPTGGAGKPEDKGKVCLPTTGTMRDKEERWYTGPKSASATTTTLTTTSLCCPPPCGASLPLPSVGTYASCPYHLTVSFSVRAVPIVTEHVTPFILSHSGVLNQSVVLCPRYAFLSFTFLINAGHASIGVALSALMLAHHIRLHSCILILGTSITV